MNFRVIKKWDTKKVFDFLKSDIYCPATDPASPVIDPYPTKGPDDIVERRTVGQEFFIEGEPASEVALRIGVEVRVDYLEYKVISVTEDIDVSTGNLKTTFVARHCEQFVQPRQMLETIRREISGAE